MATTLSVTEAVRNFSECINRVVYKRERFILRKGKKAVAELKPVAESKSLSELPDLIASLPSLSPDDVKSFVNDLADIRAERAEEELRDPWTY